VAEESLEEHISLLEQKIMSLAQIVSSQKSTSEEAIGSLRDLSTSISSLVDPETAKRVSRSLDRLSDTLFNQYTRLANRFDREMGELSLAYQSLRQGLRRLIIEKTELGTLLQLSHMISQELDIDRLLELVIDRVIELTGAERGFLVLRREEGELDFRIARNISHESLEQPSFQVSKSVVLSTCKDGEAVLLTDAQKSDRFGLSVSINKLGLRSIMCVPLKTDESIIGALYLDNRQTKGIFTEHELSLATRFAEQVAIGVRNALRVGRLKRTRDQLENELRAKYNFDGIVAQSSKMMQILNLAGKVAQSDAPVLLQGESGTGKELIARAIHFNSPRVGLPYVDVNCAAIPETLLESELFGYARGAFTGATGAKKGKFEVADEGTLFLDEIGDMSPALQAKILRVLQEKEFCPVGSNVTSKVDVRVIAATNKDLEQMVADGSFRQDLYYRLNVVKIQIPPLRDRKEDVLPLVEFFVDKFQKETGKPVHKIDDEVIEFLLAHPYPGNVRQLENAIMRLVILSEHGRLRASDLPPSMRQEVVAATAPPKTYHELLALKSQLERETYDVMEAQFVRHILADTSGNVSEAARRAEIHRRQLQRIMRKHGIQSQRGETTRAMTERSQTVTIYRDSNGSSQKDNQKGRMNHEKT
jgi:transcriptional regulator with GAF, ATPase, and Fis domain